MEQWTVNESRNDIEGMGDGEEVVLWGLHADIAPWIGCCGPCRFRMQTQISHI